MGRPTLYSDLRRRKLVGALRAGRTFQGACMAAGVAERTGRSWIARGRKETSGPYFELAREVDEAIAEAERQITARPQVPAVLHIQLRWPDDPELTFYDVHGEPYYPNAPGGAEMEDRAAVEALLADLERRDDGDDGEQE